MLQQKPFQRIRLNPHVCKKKSSTVMAREHKSAISFLQKRRRRTCHIQSSELLRDKSTTHVNTQTDGARLQHLLFVLWRQWLAVSKAQRNSYHRPTQQLISWFSVCLHHDHVLDATRALRLTPTIDCCSPMLTIIVQPRQTDPSAAR